MKNSIQRETFCRAYRKPLMILGDISEEEILRMVRDCETWQDDTR
jgi:hypothetical protein